MNPRLVFIVGLPKSGSKMIDSILMNSPTIHYASRGETFFMGRFIRPGVRHEIQRIGDMRDDANIYRLVDMMYTPAFSGGFWTRLRDGSAGIEREKLLADLLDSGRSAKDIYQVILSIHTQVHNDMVIGDKTPAHLYHVPKILEWFPDARVVHTFRDPRAVLSSEWLKRTNRAPATFYPVKLNHPLYSLMIVLHVTITWRLASRLHHRYKRRFPQNYLLVQFEEIVFQPETVIRNLCQFLGVEFHEQMLSPRRSGSSYERKGGVGFDQQAPTRWQQHLKPWMRRWLETLVRKPMKDFGYL